jgi:PII-like signaling protein
MTINQRAQLLKIYIGEGYISHGLPIYEQIIWEAKKENLGGVTVVKGMAGLGHQHVMQEEGDEIRHDVPIVIEIIDTPENIQKFIPTAAKLMGNHGLIALSDVTVLHKGILIPTERAKDVR